MTLAPRGALSWGRRLGPEPPLNRPNGWPPIRTHPFNPAVTVCGPQGLGPHPADRPSCKLNGDPPGPACRRGECGGGRMAAAPPVEGGKLRLCLQSFCDDVFHGACRCLHLRSTDRGWKLRSTSGGCNLLRGIEPWLKPSRVSGYSYQHVR